MVLTSREKFGLSSLSARRAWIEIGVDFAEDWLNAGSLSARRAWIEIVYPGTWTGSILVALRKASVDRNTIALAALLMYRWSLSARRAWIEICGGASARLLAAVALRKESVDRNVILLAALSSSIWSLSARRAWIEIHFGTYHPHFHVGRSPQGERG